MSKVTGKWDMTLFPKNKKYGGAPGGFNLCIVKSSKNKDLSWQYIQFMAQLKTEEDFFATFLTTMPRHSMLNNPNLMTYGPQNLKRPVIEVYRHAFELGAARPVSTQMSKIADFIMLAVQEALMLNKTPQATMDQLAKMTFPPRIGPVIMLD